MRFPPPILYVAGIAVGWFLNRIVPLPVTPILGGARVALGWMAVALGGAVLAWAMLTFARARTAIYPNQPARTIVAAGPYRHSRNPMYVGLACAMVGVGLLVDAAWILLFLPLVLVALTALVIRREEAYLREAFGNAYADYEARVRRWL